MHGPLHYPGCLGPDHRHRHHPTELRRQLTNHLPRRQWPLDRIGIHSGLFIRRIPHDLPGCERTHSWQRGYQQGFRNWQPHPVSRRIRTADGKPDHQRQPLRISHRHPTRRLRTADWKQFGQREMPGSHAGAGSSCGCEKVGRQPHPLPVRFKSATGGRFASSGPPAPRAQHDGEPINLRAEIPSSSAS